MKETIIQKKKMIGQRINAALAEKNVKQKELAEYLAVTDNTVSYWCSGKRTPNTEQIMQISKKLKVSADYLLGLSDAPTNDKDLQFVCEYTGLSQEAVEILSKDSKRKYSALCKFTSCCVSQAGKEKPFKSEVES